MSGCPMVLAVGERMGTGELRRGEDPRESIRYPTAEAMGQPARAFGGHLANAFGETRMRTPKQVVNGREDEHSAARNCMR
jgi:hypothetical protein